MRKRKPKYDTVPRGGIVRDMHPKSWRDKKSLVFVSRADGYSYENLKAMEDYLRLHKAPTEWYTSDNGEKALLTSIDEKYYNNICKAGYKHYRNVKHFEWVPMKGGATLRENIPLRTMHEIMRNENPSELYCLYLVSENDTIFYVGKTPEFNPINRLCERLNPYARKAANDAFAKFLRKYNEDAFPSWRIQLLTLQDCEPFVVGSYLSPDRDTGTFRSEVIEKYTTDISWAIGRAERVLIWLYRPCLNKTHNPFPTQLPAKYSEFVHILDTDKLEETHIVTKQQIQ
jgi:hypothetical protein